jgi:DNA-binding HxlR family transcriptional regulator
LLSAPLNVEVLKALSGGPMSLTELRRTVGGQSPTTIREHLQTLTAVRAIARHRENGFPGAVEYEESAAAAGLLEIGNLLQEWLGAAPDQPMTLGDETAKDALKALIGGWDSMILRAIAARPLSLTALSQLISRFNYPSLERRLSTMRSCGLVEVQPSAGRGTPYGPTEWVRRAAGPLLAAALWEQRHAAASAAPPGRLELETAFLLIAPALAVPLDSSATCRLEVEVDADAGRGGSAGLHLEVGAGKVLVRSGRPAVEPDAVITAPASKWTQALIAGELEDLRLEGDQEVATSVAQSLYRELSNPKQLAL